MFQQTGCFLSYLFSPLLKALLLPHPQLCSALQKLLPARSPESLGQGWDSLGQGWDSLPAMGWIYTGAGDGPPFASTPRWRGLLVWGSIRLPRDAGASTATHSSPWWPRLQEQQSSTSRCPLYLPHREAQTLAKVHQSSLTIYVPSGGVGPPTLCPSICCSA